ncbi:MAG: hypothetical protein IKZ87_08720, partial [Actinomycetaceae bacterium]|nr:hypothetical protein [Actinomycetaceae bacterium]
MERRGYKVYSDTVVRGIRYGLITLLAFVAPPFLFPFFLEHIGVFFAGVFLTVYVFVLGVGFMVVFETYKYYWNFSYSWQQVIKWLLFSLDDVLAVSA